VLRPHMHSIAEAWAASHVALADPSSVCPIFASKILPLAESRFSSPVLLPSSKQSREREVAML